MSDLELSHEKTERKSSIVIEGIVVERVGVSSESYERVGVPSRTCGS